MRLSHIACFSALLPVLLTGSAGAGTAVGTAFTYQGRLMETGLPANGSYDFRFTLYDAPTGGAVVVGPLTLPGVAVLQGLFTAPLDFGAPAFSGLARWLEIEVQVAGGGGYTTLTPRQELKPSPNAIFSSYTDPANLTILNASNLTSGTVPDARVSGAYSQALALPNAANAVAGTFTGDGFALTNLNASNLASGTLPGARLSGTYANPLTFPDAGNFFTGDGSGLFNLNAQPKYVRTVVLSPVGTPAENGTALLAALAGITTASASNPWLLEVEPGIYDVGATSLVMKPFVDVEGSGESVTKITGAGSGSNTVGTVQAVADTELRFVTVENTGGAAYAKAIFVDGASPRITHVTALGSGASVENQGVFVQGAAAPLITDVTIQVTAAGTSNSYGMLDIGSSSILRNASIATVGGAFSQSVWSCCGAAPTLRNVVAVASGGTLENRGVVIVDSSSQLEEVVGIATGAANNNIGVITFGASSAKMRFVTCRALGATGGNTGCGTFSGSQAVMDGILAEAVGGTNAFGMISAATTAGHSLANVRALASGASSLAVGALNESCSPPVTRLEVSASGSGTANIYGLQLSSSSSVASHVTSAAGGATSGTVAGVAVLNTGIAPNPTLAHATVTASGSSTATYGIQSTANTALTMSNVTTSVSGAGGVSYAVNNQFGSQVSMTGVRATATAPAGTTVGVYNLGASVQMTQVTATAGGAAGNRYGLFNEIAPSGVTVDRSTLNGVTNSIFNTGNSGIRIGGSQLVGLVTTAAGSSTTCVLAYNGAYAPVNALCQ